MVDANKQPVRGTTAAYKRARCGIAFMARIADRKRGWARFCSKSCKAVKQEQRTGQYAAYRKRVESDKETFSNAHLFSSEE